MIFRTFLRVDRPFSDPGGARTLDPLIKSQLLYQLSYGVVLRVLISLLRCKVSAYFSFMQIFSLFLSKFYEKWQKCRRNSFVYGVDIYEQFILTLRLQLNN